MPLKDSGITARGSSPLTRGTHWFNPFTRGWDRIIPAYAGNTPKFQRVIAEQRDHPRLRGEHGYDYVTDVSGLGSSPLTRGTPGRRRHAHPRLRIIPAYAGNTMNFLNSVSRLGIIPAYAGNTRCPSSSRCSSWDHPRLRGEH